ncbi:MAG: HdeD family acid-resistance protein [Candidatus Onthomonas sp.]
MLNFFRQWKRQSFWGAIITIVLGLILTFAPSSLLGLVLGVLGWVLLLAGIGSIIGFIFNRGLAAGYSQLIYGIIQVIFGLWIVRNPGGLVSLVASVVGILMLIHAISDLQYTVSAHRAGAAHWWTGALSGGVTLILALLVLFRPVGSVMTLASFAGICLVVDGISDLLMIHRIGDYF